MENKRGDAVLPCLGEPILGGQPSVRETEAEGHALSCPPRIPHFLAWPLQLLGVPSHLSSGIQTLIKAREK